MKNGKILGKTEKNGCYEKIVIFFIVLLFWGVLLNDKKSDTQKECKHFWNSSCYRAQWKCFFQNIFDLFMSIGSTNPFVFSIG